MDLGNRKPDPTGPDQGQQFGDVAEQLFRKHRDELSRFLMGVVANRDQVGDILQSTFTAFLEKGAAIEAGGRRAWLFRVAFNRAMLVIRKSRQERKSFRHLAWRELPNCKTPVETILAEERKQQVREAIESLNVELQQVVRMRIYQGKKFAEIASETGIPLGTVLSRMRAALKKLTIVMNSEDDSPYA